MRVLCVITAEVDSGMVPAEQPSSPAGQPVDEVTAEMQNSTLESEPGIYAPLIPVQLSSLSTPYNDDAVLLSS